MRVFIASSKEQLDRAMDIASWLEELNMEPMVWNDLKVFSLGGYTWDSLISMSEKVDAAIFIFGADDKTWYRNKEEMTVRDNVLLEYGLFSGKLSKNNTCFLCIGEPAMPSDLTGIVWGDLNKTNSVKLKLKTWIGGLKKEKTGQNGFEVTDLYGAFNIVLKKTPIKKLRIFAVSTFKSVQMLRLINDIYFENADIALRVFDSKDEYYSESMDEAIDNAIVNWKHLLEIDHKIKNLDIIRFNFHPDNGYYIFDNKYLIMGNLRFDINKKEYTFSNQVLLISDITETGRLWIQEYITQFESVKANYETSIERFIND